MDKDPEVNATQYKQRLVSSTVMSGNLDSFVTSSRPRPEPVATSQDIRDRGSTFIGTIYAATTPAIASSNIAHLRNIVHASKPATHEISAWRCMVPKDGKTGLGGPDDFEVKEGWADDGEARGGQTILKAMRTAGIIDAVVIVSRWCASFLLIA